MLIGQQFVSRFVVDFTGVPTGGSRCDRGSRKTGGRLFVVAAPGGRQIDNLIVANVEVRQLNASLQSGKRNVRQIVAGQREYHQCGGQRVVDALQTIRCQVQVLQSMQPLQTGRLRVRQMIVLQVQILQRRFERTECVRIECVDSIECQHQMFGAQVAERVRIDAMETIARQRDGFDVMVVMLVLVFGVFVAQGIGQQLWLLRKGHADVVQAIFAEVELLEMNTCMQWANRFEQIAGQQEKPKLREASVNIDWQVIEKIVR